MNAPERPMILRLLLWAIRLMTVAAELNPDRYVEEQEKGGDGQKP